VSVDNSVPFAAVIMMVTGVSYLIVQGPAFAWATKGPSPGQESLERGFALAGFIVATLCFIAYSIYQVYNTRAQSKRKEFARQQYLMQQVLARLAKRIDAVPKMTTEDAARSALTKWRVCAI